MPIKLLIFLASQGLNKKLASRIAGHSDDCGFKSHTIDLVDLDAPLFSMKLHEQNGPPESIKNLASLMRSSGALVFVGPEYNGGLPPNLTNTFAWLSLCTFPEDKHGWRSCFINKPAFLATHSSGVALKMLSALRMQLAHMGVLVMARDLSVTLSQNLDQMILENLTELHQLAAKN
ncbi:MAG: NAD(P)H-dependent oxidoreductase [Proteobacteria bacterium]|nr:NAD(P)H-dependent oxidoreductase [Pseudomonadota bacterium]